MSTPEVTPDLLRDVAAAWVGSTASDDSIRTVLRVRADRLERQQRPLPTVPGWYPSIVVERGGESCTGALLGGDGGWRTAREVDGFYGHWTGGTPRPTIRWAEQDGKTPGQTLYEATDPQLGKWSANTSGFRGRFEQRAAAVLAAHGTPTLTPVGEHPGPWTRGLLPVVVEGGAWHVLLGSFVCRVESPIGNTIFADPRPDGAHE